jgi:membrane carboxypeptidase/penicillin-binding protein PbpC
LVAAAAAIRDATPRTATSTRAVRAPGDELTIIRPLGGALFLLDPTLRAEFQALTFSARGGDGALEWFVNGTPVGTVARDEPLRWPLRRGRHVVRVLDGRGAAAETRIEVR